MYDETDYSMLVGNTSASNGTTPTTVVDGRTTYENDNGDVVVAVATPKQADAKQSNIPVTIAPASTLLLSPTRTTRTTPSLPRHEHQLAANMFGDVHDNNVITYTDRSNITKEEALLLISKKRSSRAEQTNDDDDNDDDDENHPDGSSSSNSSEDQKKNKKKKRKRRNSSSQCSTSSSKTKIPFPITLYRMLYELEMESIQAGVVVEDENKIVYWQSHGRAFIVRHPKEFVSKIIPRFFKLSKYASFQRQLNLYGFRRMTNGYDNGCYYHEYFLRGKPYLLDFIIRTKIKGNGIKRSITASPVQVQEHALSAGQEQAQEEESKSSCDANAPSFVRGGVDDSKKLESRKATGTSSSSEEEPTTSVVSTVVEPDLYAYPPLPNFDAFTSLCLQSPVSMTVTTAAANEESHFSTSSSSTMTIRSPVPFVEAAAVDSMQTASHVPRAEPITATSTPVFTRPTFHDGMMHQQSSLLTFPQQHTTWCDTKHLTCTGNHVMYHQVTPDHPTARSRQASSAFEIHKKKTPGSSSSIIDCNTTGSAIVSQDKELQVGDDRSVVVAAAAAVATVAPSMPSMFPDCLMIPSVMDQDDVIAKEHQMFKPLKSLKVNPYSNDYLPAPFTRPTIEIHHHDVEESVVLPTMISPDPSPVQDSPMMNNQVFKHESKEAASVAAAASPPLTNFAVDNHRQHSTSTVANNATEQVVVPQDDNDNDEDEEEDTIVLTFEGMKFHYLDPLFFNPRRHHFGMMEKEPKCGHKTDNMFVEAHE